MTQAAYVAELAAIYRWWERFYDEETHRSRGLALLQTMTTLASEAARDLAEINESRAAFLAYCGGHP